MIIGRSYSAEDIGSQCYQYGAKSITTTYRSKPMGFKWPDNWKQVPLLQKVVGKTAHFRRHHQGRRRHHPVHRLPAPLPVPRRLSATENQQPDVAGRPLYEGVVWGKPIQDFLHRHAGPVLHLQHVRRAGLVFRDVIMGRIELPSAEGDGGAWPEVARARGNARKCRQIILYSLQHYPRELIDQTDYPSFDIEQTSQTFMEWEHHKAENIMGFRDNAYRSLMTGTMAPQIHHTPWLQAMDNWLESSVQVKEAAAE